MTSRRRAILLVAGCLILVVIFAVSGVTASPPQQDPEFVFVVTTTEDHNDGFCNADCSLRDAIIAANQLDYHATILLPSGTYTLTLEGPGEDDCLTGDLDILSGLTIIGDGPETTIIDAAGMSGDPDRVFEIHAISIGAYNVDLSSLTITGGDAGAEDGGGIRNGSAGLVLHNSGVTGNSAQYGGGIHTHYGPVQLVDSTVTENSAAINGGGIYTLDGRIELDHTSLIGNTSGGDGGGVYSDCDESLYLEHSTVSANSAAQGGGIFGFESTMSLLESTISGNDAGEGGGIYNFYGTLYLDHSTVEGNAAETEGGGIVQHGHNLLTEVSLMDSTISGNSAGSMGGGISNKLGGEMNLYNTTVSENSAPDGGGIHSYYASTSLQNTIVANNRSGGDCYDQRSGVFLSNGHNLDSDGTCNLVPAEGDLPNADPMLGPLQDNGGPTLTHALLFGSPAIDAGDNSACGATDQRGFKRPMDGDGDGTATCDIGAFEHLGLRARFPLVLSNYGPSP